MNSREIAFNILYDIFDRKAYSNIALNKHLKKDYILDNDKSLIKEIVFGTIERKYTIDYIISILAKNGLKKIENNVLIILEMSLYQLMYMDKIPEYAAINEGVSLSKKRMGLSVSKFVNAILRNYLRQINNINFPSKGTNLLTYLCINYSYPEWIVKRLLNNYDADTSEKILKSLNEKPELCCRLNTLKLKADTFKEILKQRGLIFKPGLYNNEAFYINLKNIENDELYKKGYLQVQDEAAMLVSKVLNPQPGDTIIDVCSAPGGKTTHIAQMMENKGAIYAFDVHMHKIDIINKNCKRLGIDIVKTFLYDSTKINKNFMNLADKVLVDVPCTGIGIIRKKPDIKLKQYKPKDIELLNEIQLNILLSSSCYVKKNGFLVYSTCTIGKEENQLIIKKFLEKNKNFRIIDINDFLPETLKNRENDFVQFIPYKHNIDGFFVCKMQRLH